MNPAADFALHGFSWQPGLPDYRDYTPEHPVVTAMLTRLKPSRRHEDNIASSIDLRPYFPPAQDQLCLRSATAHAAVALIEYFQRRAMGEHTAGSIRFVYKMTRKLLGREGNMECDLRTVLKAIARFGIPPEHLCPYDVSRFDEEPEAFLYSFAEPFRPLVYARLDGANVSGSETLLRMRAFLEAGFPFALGVAVPESMTSEPDIPWQPLHDSIRGGHAFLAVGYDDQRIRSTKGALLVRNSWGTPWGDNGYAWLPYRYVEAQMVSECWTVLKDTWLDRHEFHRPAL